MNAALMESEIESLIVHLATERGLSDNYQLLTRRNLETAAAWLRKKHGVLAPADVRTGHLTDYLAERKSNGLSASSLRLIVSFHGGFFSGSSSLADTSLRTRRPTLCRRAPKVICPRPSRRPNLRG